MTIRGFAYLTDSSSSSKLFRTRCAVCLPNLPDTGDPSDGMMCKVKLRLSQIRCVGCANSMRTKSPSDTSALRRSVLHQDPAPKPVSLRCACQCCDCLLPARQERELLIGALEDLSRPTQGRSTD